MLHEVVDPDDVRVLHLGEEAPLSHGRSLCVRVTGVQQALEDHPPVADVPVPGQVDPAEAAVGQAAEYLVLASDEVTAPQPRPEVEPGAAVLAEAIDAAGAFVAAASHRLAAFSAEPLVLLHLRIGQHRSGRIASLDRRNVYQASAEPAASGAGRG